MKRYLPNYLVNIILNYDGRIKYRRGEYINIIHKHDSRYNMIEKIINKKREIMKNVSINNLEFYFEIAFENQKRTGLCYDYNWSRNNIFEICFYNFKNNNIQQIRTYL